LIARSQRERDFVSIPADDDCEQGNQARFFDAQRIFWWTRTHVSATLMQARIASLRMPALIGSTIERRVSSEAMLFGKITNHSDADASTSRPIRFSTFPKNACFPNSFPV